MQMAPRYNEDDQIDDVNYFEETHQDAEIKRKTLVAPWRNVEEFHQVYDWLFATSSSDESRWRAIAQMRVWGLRRRSLCPAAVLATAVLLEVQLKETASESSERPLTPEELQALYANAFTRFFNYMSSIMQTHNMRTMYETANQLGLPTFVVDLRHLCSHGQDLPPLEVLRSTSQHCFSWLHDYYWSGQRTSMSNVDASQIRHRDRTQFDDNVSQLFQLYDDALESYCKGARDLKKAKRYLHGKRLAQLKEFMTQKGLELLQEAFDAIVRELLALVKRETSLKDLTEIYLEALLKMNYFFVAAEKHTFSTVELHSLIQVTQGLFRMLAARGFIDELLISLIQIAESAEAPRVRRAGASFWALQIVRGYIALKKCQKIHTAKLEKKPNAKKCDFSTFNNSSISKQASSLLKKAHINIDFTLIFGSSLRKPGIWRLEHGFLEERLKNINTYTATLIKRLLTLADPALSDDQISVLSDLIDAQFEQNMAMSETRMSKNDFKAAEKVYTVEDLVSTLTETEDMDIDMFSIKESSPTDIKQFGIWSLLPHDRQDWSFCPLGRLPWD